MAENHQELIASLDIVAYRGLWDRFSGPGTIGAYRRALLKGIPFLVDLDSAGDEVRQFVSDRVKGVAAVPVFFKGAAAVSLAPRCGQSGSSALFWIDTSCELHGCHPIRCQHGGGWVDCGYYLPLAKAGALPRLARECFSPHLNFLLYESVDVLTGLEDPGLILSDRAVEQQLLQAFPGAATIVRVSDLVEGVFLQQQSG